MQHLTADQLRARHAASRDEDERRAIRRRLAALDTTPAPKAQTKPPMTPEFLTLFRRRLPPTTCAWSLAQVVETLDRTTVEWNEKGKK